MNARLLKGRPAAKEILSQLAIRNRARSRDGRRPPLLAVFTVGEDAAAEQYLRALRRVAGEIGVEVRVRRLGGETAFDAYRAAVLEEAGRSEVDGVQLLKPLPERRHVWEVMQGVTPEKDVEGVHPENLGLLLLGRPRYIPCTAAAVMVLLERHGIDLSGRKAVVVGRSDTVGKPLASLLLSRHATVTICHSITADLEAEVRRADVLVAALGRPEHIRGEWVRSGATVVDLGHHVLPDGRTVGDVEVSARERAGALTPVPGGAGPITVAVLMSNLLEAAHRRRD